MATSQQHVPQGNKARKPNKTIRAPKKQQCSNTAKPYIVFKRLKTWGWQDRILVPRTRTDYAERRTNGCAYLRWIGKHWATLADSAFRTYVGLREPEKAICHVFGNYCTEALVVARCESGHSYSVNAHNGQYLGMFQMGSSERATYGHGSTPLEQAYAAHKYFVASGRDWSPWSCKP